MSRIETGLIATHAEIRVVRQRDHRLWFHSHWPPSVGCIDLASGSLLWQQSWERSFRDSDSPRQIVTQRGSLWCDADGRRIAHLDDMQTGARLTCRDAADGVVLWQREVPLPPPAWFAEPKPAAEGLPTEHLQGLLMQTERDIVVAISRNSRGVWTSGADMPPWQCQLDLIGMERASGDTLFERCLPSASVPLMERNRFDGLLRTDTLVGRVDPATGSLRWQVDVPGASCWPVQYDDRILVAWRVRGGCVVASVAPGGIVKRHQHKRTGVKEVQLLRTRLPVLQINDQFVLPLDDSLAPMWEARCKPWVYCVDRQPDRPVVVGTAGRGGQLYLLDQASGRELLCDKGEAGSMFPITNTELSSSGRMIHPAEQRILRYETPVPHADQVASWGRTAYFFAKTGLFWARYG